jgi:hypothetical protein
MHAGEYTPLARPGQGTAVEAAADRSKAVFVLPGLAGALGR